MADLGGKVKGSRFSLSDRLPRGRIKVRFKDGVSHEKAIGYTTKQIAKKVIEGFTTEHFNAYTQSVEDYDVPPRPLFEPFTKEKRQDIIKIVKHSYILRFQHVKAVEQFTIAANQIRDLLVEWVDEGNVRPENTAWTKKVKGDKPAFIDSGQTIDSLEGVYVPDVKHE